MKEHLLDNRDKRDGDLRNPGLAMFSGGPLQIPHVTSVCVRVRVKALNWLRWGERHFVCQIWHGKQEEEKKKGRKCVSTT